MQGWSAVRRWRWAAGAVLLLMLSGGWSEPMAWAATYHVRAGAGGVGGTSWADAFDTVQQGLDAAQAGDEVWVSAGTYVPTSSYGMSGDSRVKHWRLKNNVAVYGGFPATGDPNESHRDPAAYATILSGDLAGNDNPDTPVEELAADATRGENVYHLFYHPNGLGLSAAAVLDGFTLRGGNANAAGYPHNTGGGMHNYTANSPTIRACCFEGNIARDGGGAIFSFTNNLTLTGCSFVGNVVSATEAKGGGVYGILGAVTLEACWLGGNNAGWGGGAYLDRCPAILTECTFVGNTAAYGGGLYNCKAGPTLTDCSFSFNAATGYGGGIRNFDGSSPRLIRCSFSTNSAGSGGGVHNHAQCHPVCRSCSFIGNTATNGGGMYNLDSSAPVLRYCLFYGNNATESGGGMRNYGSSPQLGGCSFIANIAGNGGGMSGYGGNPRVEHCLFEGNTAGGFGGGVQHLQTAATTFDNCIFIGGRATEGTAVAVGPDDPNKVFMLTFRHCILDDSGAAISKSSQTKVASLCSNMRGIVPDVGDTWRGVIDVDPLFVRPGYWQDGGVPEDPNDDVWVWGDYRLQSQAGRWQLLDPPSADFDDSGCVDLRDFVVLSNSWLVEGIFLPADLDSDGIVDTRDLLVFAEQFLSSAQSRWVADEATSRCIDAGSPAADSSVETGANNIRVNIGAYGGTFRASRPPAGWSLLTDMTNDGYVDLEDFAGLAGAYLGTDAAAAANFNRDKTVDIADVILLAEQWLQTTVWSGS